MNIIELKRWKPSENDPRKPEYAGQPMAQEVFEELKYRLESQGYLPDEYFLLDDHWENGREIPKDADIFCSTDYGGSEGVYLDVYLKWYENGKPIIKSFITGKTLGENGNDLDRMFLISSAITKAFHGDNATHSRHMKIGGVEEDTGGRVIHLSQREEKVLIDALVEQRERQEQAMGQTEQLLRRTTGSITAYMDMVGQRPLHLSGFDKTVLAIRDGELSAFKELYPKVLEKYAGDLLIAAAGRPGAVGRQMTLLLLESGGQAYRAACENAIGINDPEKVFFLLEQADRCAAGLSPSFHGEMASHAFCDHRFIAREIIKRCTEEQISAAPPYLLEQFAMGPDYEILSALVEKGISGGDSAAKTLHMLTYGGRDSWMAKDLLQKRTWVDANDYQALHIQDIFLCLDHDEAGIEACGRLTEILHGHGYNNVTVVLPEYKDWNEDLKAAHGLPALQAEEHPQLTVAPDVCQFIVEKSKNIKPDSLERDLSRLMSCRSTSRLSLVRSSRCRVCR